MTPGQIESLTKAGRLVENGRTKEFKKNNLILYLDKSQIFPNDPGAGTPALVMYESGSKYGKDYCSTYWAAVSEGELLGSRDVKRLTTKQIEWLESLESEVEDFINENQ